MSHLSRRSFVASAAALSALAVPAVAVAVSAEPDPIFAAIGPMEGSSRGRERELRRPKRCSRGVPRSVRQLNAEWHAERDGRDLPKRTTTKTSYWFMKTHEQITALKNHADFGQFVPLFHRTLNDQTNDYDENVAPLDEASDQACSIRIDAAYAVFDTCRQHSPACVQKLTSP